MSNSNNKVNWALPPPLADAALYAASPVGLSATIANALCYSGKTALGETPNKQSAMKNHKS